MTKKTISKVIAMVCVAALCLTAVFTGVVSATNQTANYTVVGRGYDQGAKDSFVAADVTFSGASSDFVAGSFKVTASGLSLVDCTSSDSDAKCYLNVSNNKVLFAGFTESATNDISPFDELTLTLLFTINSGKLEDQGTDWAVPVTLSDIDLTNEAEETYTCAASGTPVAIHVHNFAVTSQTSTVKTYTCSVCGTTKTEVVAESSTDTNELANSKSTAARFTKDGDIELLALVDNGACAAYDSVYFSYSYKTDDGEAHEIATAEADLYNGYRVFACKGNRGIGRMGRVVTGNFIGVKDGNVTTSGVWEYSVKEYAESLFNNADADIVGYAKSLWNYGKYTAEAINGYDYEQGTFSAEAQTVSPEWSTTAATAPTYNAGSDDSWKIKKAQVTTGYKPSMKLTFSNNAGNAAPTCDSIVIKVTHDFGGNIGEKIVYHKEVAITSMLSDGSYKYFSISDIPTKYLTDDITITAKTGDVESAKIGTYGFGRYTKSRMNAALTDPDKETQANVFKWMMTFAMYLGQEYA